LLSDFVRFPGNGGGVLFESPLGIAQADTLEGLLSPWDVLLGRDILHQLKATVMGERTAGGTPDGHVELWC